MAPRKSRSFAIWSYFENQEEIGKAVCTICKLVLKNNRNHNLKQHLVRQHQIHPRIRRSDCSASSSNSDIMSSISARIKLKINKQILFKSYIGLVIEDHVPFNLLNSPNLKNIFDPVSDSLGEKLGNTFRLNEKNCKSALEQVAANIRTSMKMEMSKRLLSLKIDTSSRLTGNLIAITAQLIVEDQIRSFTLGLVDLNSTGESESAILAAEIFNLLNKYDIQLNQIISITSDDEANMMETRKFLWIYKSIEDEKLQDINICQCAAHTAQLCALDVAKDPEIEGFLLSCRNLIKFIRIPSNGFEDISKLRNIELPQLDCATKWLSTYAMIHALLVAKDEFIAVESIDNKSIDENFDNCDGLWDFMECYVTVFATLQDTLIKFQQDRNLHYGNLYAQWLKCKMLTNKIVQANNVNKMLKKIGNKLVESMEKRTSELLENESLNACLFLDPRFQHTLSIQKKQQAVTYLKNLWENIYSVSDHMAISKISYNEPLMANESTFEDEADEMLNTFLTEKLQATYGEIIDTDIHLKIWNLHLPFLRSDTDVLLFWSDRRHSEPELYALSNVCFGIPPTKFTIDGAFQSLENIITNNPNDLNHAMLENILLVKLNPIFLCEAVKKLPLFEDTNAQCEDVKQFSDHSAQ